MTKFFSIHRPSGMIIAQVVDHCPGCGPNAIDLADPAYIPLYGVPSGRRTGTWRFVPCPATTNIRFRMQGSNPYYLKVQVLDTPSPVTALEWFTFTHSPNGDGYFSVVSHFWGAGAYQLRVTDSQGNQTSESVPLLSDTEEYLGFSRLQSCLH